MDLIKAKELESRLAGKTVGSWMVHEYVNHGKSAALFRGTGSSGDVAIKIFDDALIHKYGDATQLTRIGRELELVGKFHPNLISILGGGFESRTNSHFIVMDFIRGKNLKECLQEVPAANIPSFVSQLASAAHFLEGLGFVHRDIKPENIIISADYSKLVLLDLGVIRLIAGSNLTDQEGIQAFIGTLQYSSPEFLLREEEDSDAGWRSLTFYQIGGVLHDLIMRRQLFEEFAEPYARLVNAVQHVTPEIQNSAVPHYLIELARCCLLKNWRARLQLLEWSSFEPPKSSFAGGQSAKQRVTNRGTQARALQSEAASESAEDRRRAETLLTKEVVEALSAFSRTIRAENAALPPLRILPRTPGDADFGIEFRSATTFGLEHDVTIFVHVDILEVAARAIAVSACCCVGRYARDQKLGVDHQTIFQGTYDMTSAYSALEDCLYDLIDQAQSAQGAKDQSIWTVPRVEPK